MQRIQIHRKPKTRPRPGEPLPLDPRDPAIVRAKALQRREGGNGAGEGEGEAARRAD